MWVVAPGVSSFPSGDAGRGGGRSGRVGRFFACLGWRLSRRVTSGRARCFFVSRRRRRLRRVTSARAGYFFVLVRRRWLRRGTPSCWPYLRFSPVTPAAARDVGPCPMFLHSLCRRQDGRVTSSCVGYSSVSLRDARATSALRRVMSGLFAHASVRRTRVGARHDVSPLSRIAASARPHSLHTPAPAACPATYLRFLYDRVEKTKPFVN